MGTDFRSIQTNSEVVDGPGAIRLAYGRILSLAYLLIFNFEFLCLPLLHISV